MKVRIEVRRSSAMVRCVQRAVVVVSMCVGCFGVSQQRTLTTADLERMASGKILDSSIEDVETNAYFSIHHGSPTSATAILKSLMPISRSEVHVGESATKPDYVFTYQSGRDPVVFKIRICGSALCFSVDQVEYEGGNAADFLSAIKSILKR